MEEPAWNVKDLLYRFMMDDLRGFLITDDHGNVLYKDEKSGRIDLQGSNWAVACPSPRDGQKAEEWDLMDFATQNSYLVRTSSIIVNDRMLQFHYLTDISVYTGIYKDISEYSRVLKEEKEHDHLTGLYNKGKFIECKRSLFRKQDSIAVFNMDVNNLKQINDTYGHEAGDRLIQKAANSIHKVSARNVLGFRVGGDEFIVVGIHLTREKADLLFETWEEGLAELVCFFELACALSGYMSGVNPFDQPGVEAYKKNMFRMLGKPGAV